MTPDELNGVMTCPECTGYREKMFEWEKKFWRLSSVLIECIGDRANVKLPGHNKTWAQAFTALTGVKFADAQARAILLRDRARISRRGGSEK